MTNSELFENAPFSERRGYMTYLRYESIKGLLDSSYKPDKSFNSYKVSKFYDPYISYSEYLAEALDNSIRYSNYVSEQCYNISYSEYLSEKIK